MPVTGSYGLLAEFADADALVAAAGSARAAGYTALEAFSPYPLPAAADALGYRRSWVPTLFLLGGAVGGAGGLFMQWWISAVDYPINVGGRPRASWPLFIPVAFELTVLIAALSGLFGLLILCRLPRFHHPLFTSPKFTRATVDGFFLCIAAGDPKFEPEATREFLAGLGAVGVEGVEA